MNRLVALVMIATIAAIGLQITKGDQPAWLGWASLGLVLASVLLAGSHTVPSAVRLGSRVDSPAVQSATARAILRDHLFCLAAIASVVTIQLAFA